MCSGAATGAASAAVSGGTAPYTYTWSSGIASVTNQAAGLTAGTYTVTIADANGCSTTKTFTITEPAPVTAPAATTPVSYVYGAVAVALSASAATDNSLLWYNTQTGGTGSSTAPTPSTNAVGTQTYWVSQITADGCESERTRIEVIITPAVLIVTPNSGQNKVYGSVNPVYQYTVSGFVSGDNASVISGDLGRQPGENVGNYLYNVGTLASVNNNYTFTILQEHFAITPAPVDVQVTPGQSKPYGTSDPKFAYTASGLVNGDTEFTVFIGSLQRAPGENVGLYPINQGTLQPNSNYQLMNFTGADFEIVLAPITGVYLNDEVFVYDGTR